MLCLIWVILPILMGAEATFAADSTVSGDAYVRYDAGAMTWTCGTGLIEQQLQLADGHFRLATLTNRLTGSEYVSGAGSDEFHFLFGGIEFTGESGGYTLRNYEISQMAVPKASPGIERAGKRVDSCSPLSLIAASPKCTTIRPHWQYVKRSRGRRILSGRVPWRWVVAR